MGASTGHLTVDERAGEGSGIVSGEHQMNITAMDANRATATRPATATSIARERKNPMAHILLYASVRPAGPDGVVVWLPGMGSNHR